MRILITNDDGITAPGLAILEEVAERLAGPDGEVWTVAPDREKSAVSHAISYTVPMRVTELGPRRYTVDGFPADCVILGLKTLMREARPDLVLSGVNKGRNAAEDVIYSGTVGAAMEAALNGVPAIALSQFYRAWEGAPDDLWDPARALTLDAVRQVLRMPCPPGVFYNVNFPAHRPGTEKGLRVCAHALRIQTTYEAVPFTSPNGREFHFLRHGAVARPAGPDEDASLLIDGWTTVTPIRPQMTADDLLGAAQATLGADSGAASV